MSDKIEELEIENMKELFSVLEKNESFKSIELNKIQCGQVYEFATSQQSKITELEKENKNLYEFNKSLRCCGNCNHSPKMKSLTACPECIRGLNYKNNRSFLNRDWGDKWTIKIS